MKISQREAHRLKKQVATMEARERGRNSLWTREYIGGTMIDYLQLNTVELAKITTAKKLGFALVATLGSDDKLYIHAIR